MPTVADIIRIAREKKGWTQADLARAASVSRATVSDWEKGDTAPTRKRAPLVARVLGLPVGSLQPIDHPSVESVDLFVAQRKIRLMGWDDVGHTASGVVSSKSDAFVLVDQDLPADAYALRVRDDSMAPEFAIGEIIVLSSTPSPSSGDAVVVTFANGEKYLRTYQARGVDKTGAPAFDLLPQNPDYPTVTVNYRNPVTTMAVVVEHRRRQRPKA